MDLILFIVIPIIMAFKALAFTHKKMVHHRLASMDKAQMHHRSASKLTSKDKGRIYVRRRFQVGMPPWLQQWQTVFNCKFCRHSLRFFVSHFPSVMLGSFVVAQFVQRTSEDVRSFQSTGRRWFWLENFCSTVLVIETKSLSGIHWGLHRYADAHLRWIVLPFDRNP